MLILKADIELNDASTYIAKYPFYGTSLLLKNYFKLQSCTTQCVFPWTKTSIDLKGSNNITVFLHKSEKGERMDVNLSQTQRCEQLAVQWVSGSLPSAQSTQSTQSTFNKLTVAAVLTSMTCLLVQSCLNLFCTPLTERLP